MPNSTPRKNKHLTKETKSRIYKTTLRPIMIYIAETRPDTKRLLETTEMKVLRKIARKIFLDRERTENMRNMCKVGNVIDWVLKRKQEWNSHISRMTSERLVRIARDISLRGRRSIGLPRKRWCYNLDPGD
ncbi:uncharacterized protein LOC130896542 [Diorhabda carinulata]|uniref:uncharacterized protein LOC130896542 n=1 Tax=Diorhabda carinulata TaxID=1163345 RepID=UPI0025A257E9|nr:uncharacterized protein LOC130896542 [Diorhabda carinulata]